MWTSTKAILTLLCYSSFLANASFLDSTGSSNFNAHTARPRSHHAVRKAWSSRPQLHPRLPLSTASNSVQKIDSTTLQDINTLYQRRLTTIVSEVTGDITSIPSWLSSLGPDGKWPDSQINYTSGCDARRANWPAQTHWQRISTMAAAWHGGLAGAEKYVNDSSVRSNISLAMDYWFAHDFTDISCLASGGTPSCPCGTPGFWNTNWYSNIILIPVFVSETCLLLNETLSPTQVGNCSNISLRAYGTFDHYVHGLGYLTGANTLDVAKVGIDQGILALNVSLITDAYQRIHETVVIEPTVKADGIRPDGSFSQHDGILYSGNYGKDFTNDVLDLEIAAGGTQFEAGPESQNAFGTLLEGDLWMIYRNIRTQVVHWDFSVLGRFISFPVVDNQATGSTKINVSEIAALGKEWNSSVLTQVANSLLQNSSDANQGDIVGNRLYYNSDYMVNRGPGYVTSVKMYSNRTLNTECTNSQNPLGFHLSDGVVYTYLEGNDYEDIAAAWDWNLIPGITVDYGAIPLICDNTRLTGIETFVGGATDGTVGAAVMRYTNPVTRALSWQKAWFFLDDDVQHVMISHISSTSAAPVYSVLDQKRLNGGVFVDGVGTYGGNFSNPSSMWHGSVGYVFQPSNGSFSLSVETGYRTGNWSSIGTSTQPPATVDLFAAWIDHQNISTPISYTAFPSTDFGTFVLKSNQAQIKDIANDQNVSALFDATHNTAMIVFWNPAGGAVSFDFDGAFASLHVTSHSNAVVVYRLNSGNVTVSDPSQTLTQLVVNMSLGNGTKPKGWGNDSSKSLSFTLPTNGLAGSSVYQVLSG
ncbi:polysaccharide lyase family 8 protein [Serpula lacrymans var. lacrymans S7.3]|uniref:Polysaccharide lyase family 8 protein n=1 Tax=Serpula lacrymans var. lacrymans (strain S7.3) TaxID=936435 RepID=F8QBF3_SERL3|nr:polysaccharide lyase family 8 protein [Serpula lacrymans var. lacrymans S7.3]